MANRGAIVFIGLKPIASGVLMLVFAVFVVAFISSIHKQARMDPRPQRIRSRAAHVRRILKKLELRSRAQLAARATERGLHDAAGRD